MTRLLSVRNRQRTRPVDTRLLRQIALWALEEQFGDAAFELGIHLVGAAEMARVNETFLNHAGSTDVITFNHGEPQPPALEPRRGQEPSGSRVARLSSGGFEPTHPPSPKGYGVASVGCYEDGVHGEGRGGLHGELFICVDDAVGQARQFGTTWQGEVVRYVLHGLLHLHGFDDLEPAARRRMKREENRLVRLAGRRFSLRRVART